MNLFLKSASLLLVAGALAACGNSGKVTLTTPKEYVPYRVQRFLWEMEDFEDLVTELQRWSGKPVPQAERVRGRGNQSLYGENQLGVG